METLEAIDLGALYWFGSLHRPWLDAAVRTLTYLGAYLVLLPFTVGCMTLLAALGRPRLAIVLALVSLASLGLEWGVKGLVQRPRPDVAWRLIDVPGNPSFPSGHALRPMAIYVGAALLLGRVAQRRWLATLLVVEAVGLGLAIGLTRTYLGVHYPVDVLAGWVGGLACALVGNALADLGERAKDPPPQAG